ncbi:glycosyl hydrolase family 17 protein [Candidatus Kapabacteria bacterium]|nr:glycosyl hydrolase family 17 protein [Candidatus Kapabacteria bacterium]
MRKFLKIINVVMVISFCFLIACNSDKQNKNIMEDIKDNSENQFVEREFKPYLNGNFIGNAISYGPYREGQAPGQKGPSEEQIKEDLEILSSRYNLIRVYNADDDTRLVLETIRNYNIPMKVMLGIWLERERDKEKSKQNKNNIEYGINLANEYKDEVIAVSVGNEAQVYWSYHRMKIENQFAYIDKVRESTTQPITVADDYSFWVDDTSRTLASKIDFITTHAHPAWNGLQVENSVQWLDSIYTSVAEKHPNKLQIVGETGWPTKFNKEQIGDGQQGSLIKGEISTNAQEKFLNIYNNWVDSKKITSFLFEAFDEPWKGGGEASGENEVEKHWGIFYENRTPKF